MNAIKDMKSFSMYVHTSGNNIIASAFRPEVMFQNSLQSLLLLQCGSNLYCSYIAAEPFLKSGIFKVDDLSPQVTICSTRKEIWYHR